MAVSKVSSSEVNSIATQRTAIVEKSISRAKEARSAAKKQLEVDTEEATDVRISTRRSVQRELQEREAATRTQKKQVLRETESDERAAEIKAQGKADAEAKKVTPDAKLKFEPTKANQFDLTPARKTVQDEIIAPKKEAAPAKEPEKAADESKPSGGSVSVSA